MTREQATATAAFFKAIGGFTKVEVEEVGWGTGNFRVNLWSVNPTAGNRNLHFVKDEVTTEKEAKLIAKVAKGKATERDQQALGRIAAEKANS